MFFTIYKSFIRHRLDYRDIIYYKAFNEYFYAKLKSLQYDATLAITRAIRKSSTEKTWLRVFKIKTVQKN